VERAGVSRASQSFLLYLRSSSGNAICTNVMRKQIKMIMHLRFLSEKLLTTILLLLGYSFLQGVLVIALPLLLPTSNLEFFLSVTSNAYWIGNTIFGFVIMWFTRRIGLTALPIGLLSIVLPTYGTIFYLLTSLQNKSHD
jgi:hypothetical protein